MHPHERQRLETNLTNCLRAESEADAKTFTLERGSRKYWRHLNELGRLRTVRLTLEQELAADDGTVHGKQQVLYKIVTNCALHSQPGQPSAAVFVNESPEQVACADCAADTTPALHPGLPKRLYIACRLHDGPLRSAILRIRRPGELTALCPACVEQGRAIQEHAGLHLGQQPVGVQPPPSAPHQDDL